MAVKSRMRWVGIVAVMGRNRNLCTVLVGKPEGKRSLGRLRCRWEDIIQMNLKQIGWEGMECVYLAQDRDKWQAVVSMVMNLWVVLDVGNFLTT
jgi:hypothetical protein